MNSYKTKRTFIGQLPIGSDLYNELTKVVQRENIRIGRIHGVGATTHAVIAYYDQKNGQYTPLELSGGMEILTLQGNVSIRDDKPFVHLHILLGDAAGKVYGGHVMSGTRIFACEVSIDEFEGPELTRERDERTGLFLWKGSYL